MMLILRPLVILTFLFAGVMDCMSCRFTSSKAVNQLRTQDTPLSQQQALKDDQWQFEVVGSLPAERVFHGITCTSEGFCWVWNRRSMWTFDSRDGWRHILSLESEQADVLSGAFVSSRRTGWLSKSSGLYRTQDGGNSWTKVDVPELDDHKGRIEDIYFRDEKVGWIVGGKYRELRKGEDLVNNAISDDRKSILTGCILRTSDGGLSWKLQETGRFVGRFERVVFRNSVGAAFGDANCVITTDDGKHWTEILRRFRHEDTGEVPEATSAFFVDEKRGWITLSGAEIISTQDGGKSWRMIYGPTESQSRINPETLAEISFIDSIHGLALSRDLGGGKLFKTSDGGKTWTEIVTDERFQSVSLQEKEHGFLVSNQTLYSVRRH